MSRDHYESFLIKVRFYKICVCAPSCQPQSGQWALGCYIAHLWFHSFYEHILTLERRKILIFILWMYYKIVHNRGLYTIWHREAVYMYVLLLWLRQRMGSHSWCSLIKASVTQTWMMAAGSWSKGSQMRHLKGRCQVCAGNDMTKSGLGREPNPSRTRMEWTNLHIGKRSWFGSDTLVGYVLASFRERIFVLDLWRFSLSCECLCGDYGVKTSFPPLTITVTWL